MDTKQVNNVLKSKHLNSKDAITAFVSENKIFSEFNTELAQIVAARSKIYGIITTTWSPRGTYLSEYREALAIVIVAVAPEPADKA